MKSILSRIHFLILAIIIGILAFLWINTQIYVVHAPAYEEKMELRPRIQQVSPDLRAYDF